MPERDHFLLVAPRWTSLRAGWLLYSNESFDVYRIDHYALWAGLVPDEIKGEFDSTLPNSPASGSRETTL